MTLTWRLRRCFVKASMVWASGSPLTYAFHQTFSVDMSYSHDILVCYEKLRVLRVEKATHEFYRRHSRSNGLLAKNACFHRILSALKSK